MEIRHLRDLVPHCPLHTAFVLWPRVLLLYRRSQNLYRPEDPLEECLVLLENLLVDHGLGGCSLSEEVLVEEAADVPEVSVGDLRRVDRGLALVRTGGTAEAGDQTLRLFASSQGAQLREGLENGNKVV